MSKYPQVFYKYFIACLICAIVFFFAGTIAFGWWTGIVMAIPFVMGMGIYIYIFILEWREHRK